MAPPRLARPSGRNGPASHRDGLSQALRTFVAMTSLESQRALRLPNGDGFGLYVIGDSVHEGSEGSADPVRLTTTAELPDNYPKLTHSK